ncbi:hypothetical protein STTU_3642 [Streptomyces sp. Tu6071]|nr:hypothetical protein STTU_3642 [Streptomyces sp. Tu6071]
MPDGLRDVPRAGCGSRAAGPVDATARGAHLPERDHPPRDRRPARPGEAGRRGEVKRRLNIT